jgi:hypothetical protein
MPNLPPVDERVRVIREAMSELRWGREEEKRLVLAWDCSPSAVRTAAAEASRQLACLLSGNAQRDKRRIELWFAEVETDCETLRRLGQHFQAGKLALQAAALLAKLTGLDGQGPGIEGESEASHEAPL